MPNEAPRVVAYQLKITLVGSTPSIWRRVVVPGEITLEQLHEVIQVTFAWENCHLHAFEIGRQRYGVPDPDDFGPPELPESKVRVCDVVKPRSKFAYEYDFGDDWVHEIRVEKVAAAPPDGVRPSCLAGERAAPLEDSGGVWGYENKLAVLGDPEDPEYDDIVEWMPRGFDPARFDLDAVNAGLTQLAAEWERAEKKKAARKARAAAARSRR